MIKLNQIFKYAATNNAWLLQDSILHLTNTGNKLNLELNISNLKLI